jgi:hypothetical protein
MILGKQWSNVHCCTDTTNRAAFVVHPKSWTQPTKEVQFTSAALFNVLVSGLIPRYFRAAFFVLALPPCAGLRVERALGAVEGLLA